ncbi:sensor histidine kinase [Plantibacter cousiniae (nom. nud.)]|uniref:Oxygen sensor histidine kinase NreB n=1 Tax=Plantibacter cousiniae (nom. nud.) TaxID=199709 RepID=A0ABY1LIM8_9MICO|nr:sensor histidine kinase [Plantibacter cousiniae]SKC38300.1 Signal transduction histidine kinase [Plantibacter cousiniae]
MDGRRWWDVAFGAGCVIVGALVSVSAAGAPERTVGVWIVLAALCLVYYTAGRRTLERPQGGLWFAITLIALTAVGTAFSPNVLTLQCLVFPLLWVLTPNTRNAIVLNIVSAATLALGFLVGQGATPEAILQGLAIQSVSLVFALSLGLWITRIAELGDEKARLLVSLQTAQAESERASREAGAAAERERMARDIHDTIAQSLTSVVLLAQRARSEVGETVAGTPDASPLDGRPIAALDSIDLIESTARDALREARSLVATLAAMPAADTTLGDSLRRLGERFGRETGLVVEVDAPSERFERAPEVVLLRSTQEGLANIRKHAAADRVELVLTVDDGWAELRISDDGVGIADPEGALLGTSPGAGFGLHGMHDRVTLLGGTVELTSAAGAGTTVRVRVPATIEAGPSTSSGTADGLSAGSTSTGSRAVEEGR